jgi:hypothetical protein
MRELRVWGPIAAFPEKRPSRGGRKTDDADVARREKLAAEIVADALLTRLIKERLQELDALDAELAVAEEATAKELGRTTLRKARRRSSAAEASTPVAIAGARFGRAGSVR